MKGNKNFLIIIPAYNEELSIKNIIENIQNLNRSYNILIVDDFSTDDTYKISSKISPTIRHAKNLGIGGAVQTGIKYAKNNGYDFCIQIDGDGQHIVSEIEKLIIVQREKSSSVTIGSRYINNDSFTSTFYRRLGSKLISFTLFLFYNKQRITDPTSGMRLLDKKAITLFSDNYPSDFPEPISLAIAIKNKLKISEAPVHMREREFGKSSINGFNTIKYMIKVLVYILILRFFL